MRSALHLFSTDLAPARIAELELLLSPDEIARAGRFQFEADRAGYVASRGTLRIILAGYLGRPPQSIPLTHEVLGKPVIRFAESHGLCFNLSRARDLCLVAVTEGVEVGVDVETLRPLDDALTIAKNRFTPAEAAAIDSPESFFALWTRKEAVSKCLGWGLTLPFDVFSVTARPGSGPERVIIEHQGESSTLWIQEVPLDRPGLVAAIATESEAPVGLPRFLGPPPSEVRFLGSTGSSTSAPPPTQERV